MLELFSVNHVAFILFGYPMSYLELAGTLFNLWSVLLVARKKTATWPVGIVGVLLFMLLFYQIRLYADTIEQIYYFFTGFYGWWQWTRCQPATPAAFIPQRSSPIGMAAMLALTLALSILTGWWMSQWHLLWPAVFPQPASYPYLDALTTWMSFTATLLMAQKRIECWYYWILVDVLGVGVYFAKDVLLVALLYGVYLVLACGGLFNWRKDIPPAGQRQTRALYS